METTNNNTVPATTPDTGAALTLRQQLAAIPFSQETGIQLRNLGNAVALAEFVAEAGFMPKGQDAKKAAVAIIHGATIGLNPFQSIQSISVVNGRPALWGDAVTALVKASPKFGGEKIEFVKQPGNEDSFGVRVTVWRKGQEDFPTVEQFTVADAKRAGLWGKRGPNGPSPWVTYPKQMLKHRACAAAYRQAFADVLGGFRYAEEERDIPGAVVEGAPDPSAGAPAETPTPAPTGKVRRGAKPKDLGPITDADFAMTETPAAPAPAESAASAASSASPENDPF